MLQYSLKITSKTIRGRNLLYALNVYLNHQRTDRDWLLTKSAIHQSVQKRDRREGESCVISRQSELLKRLCDYALWVRHQRRR